MWGASVALPLEPAQGAFGKHPHFVRCKFAYGEYCEWFENPQNLYRIEKREVDLAPSHKDVYRRGDYIRASSAIAR
jgi:hypothetical protein